MGGEQSTRREQNISKRQLHTLIGKIIVELKWQCALDSGKKEEDITTDDLVNGIGKVFRFLLDEKKRRRQKIFSCDSH